ncbi:lytic transglycosylase domain-containing protein [Ideonella sp.]|uniref:lytic transglycosylase domain-containing protein n=1 Tax=Ideonella sp. TaxID=1929293 RepID=UPI0035B47246
MRGRIAAASARWLVGIGLAAAWPTIALADSALRFKCTLIDGSVHLLIEDLALRHPGMVTACEPVQVPIAPTPAPAGDARGRAGLSERLAALVTTVVNARGSSAAAPPASMPSALAALVQAASSRYRLDAALVSALIFVESRYRPDARSPKGALGLMQLMPDTAARYGVTTERELLDPSTNVDVGVRHLQSLHELYGGRVDLMLAAYNAGEGAVRKHGNRVPPYPETEAYVQQIIAMSRSRRDP